LQSGHGARRAVDGNLMAGSENAQAADVVAVLMRDENPLDRADGDLAARKRLRDLLRVFSGVDQDAVFGRADVIAVAAASAEQGTKSRHGKAESFPSDIVQI